jgi:hypothetical protein
MKYGLERNIKRDLFGYCLLHPRFYENLERYVASETTYRDVVQSLLPDGWEIHPERLWYAVLPPDMNLPAQGFKIHLSATTATAIELLRRVTPVLTAAGTTFKVVADPSMLDFQNSKNYPRGSSGKFVTIYPRDEEQCRALLESLHAATEDLRGPHILSDRPFRDSKVVFYRYGAFLSSFQMTIYGDRTPVILGPDGQWVADSRGPAFQLPPGMTDPFQPPLKTPSAPLLNGRFRVESAESFSNSGGVYQATDTHTNRRVIIKEARPGAGSRDGSTSDATHILAKEYRVLLALQSTGYVPAAVDYFQEWEHQFLVEELVEGMPLSQYRALEEFGLLVNRSGADDVVSTFCFRLRQITRKLIDAVRSCHEQGIVLGDLSPDNVIIDEKTLSLKLIDFEGASIVAEDGASNEPSMATAGFISPSRRRGERTVPADDWYSLGAVIYSLILPMQAFFHLHPEAQERFLHEVTKDQGLPPEMSDLISALFDARVSRAEEIVAGEFSFPKPARGGEDLPSRETLEDTVRGITAHILSVRDTSRDDRLFPSDYRVFSTNPLSIAYGALGQALYLQAANGALPPDITEWIARQPLSGEDYAPGLYIGLAGVGWGLAELGLESAGREAMRKAYDSPLLYESRDLFYGCAGTGLASLYWWQRTGEHQFLAKACELGDHLLRTATADPAGYYWLNVDGGHHFGYAHGGSGIALFLLYLHRATRDARYLEFAIGGLDYEIAQARVEAGYVVWSRAKDSTIYSPYWRYGNGGIGSALIRFHAILRDQRYLDLAGKAAAYAATRFATFAGQFVGLSGMGEFLLDMYRFTGDPHYREEAQRVAAGILLYAVPEPAGIGFPGDELVRLTTDFGAGSAGIGMFFHRLLHPGDRLFHDLGLNGIAVGHEGAPSAGEAERLEYQCAD